MFDSLKKAAASAVDGVTSKVDAWKGKEPVDIMNTPEDDLRNHLIAVRCDMNIDSKFHHDLNLMHIVESKILLQDKFHDYASNVKKLTLDIPDHGLNTNEAADMYILLCASAEIRRNAAYETLK